MKTLGEQAAEKSEEHVIEGLLASLIEYMQLSGSTHDEIDRFPIILRARVALHRFDCLDAIRGMSAPVEAWQEKFQMQIADDVCSHLKVHGDLKKWTVEDQGRLHFEIQQIVKKAESNLTPWQRRVSAKEVK